jgi:hypothetical protein
MATDAKWTVNIEEDPDTGDLLLPFPEDMLTSMGWQEGDTLSWNIDENNNITLTKASKGSNIEQ